MNKAIRFLSTSDVITIHKNTIEYEGGLAGVRDYGLLESAVMLPQQSFGGQYLHPDLPTMAGAYLFHLIQNHPFNDGNKRTAVLSTLVFLKGNGIQELPDPDELYTTTLKVAESKMSKREVTEWLRSIFTTYN